MLIVLRLVSLLLVVATVIPSVAHALEWPGKMRLSREHYLAVQPIYYPGFTIIGAAEPLSILALATLLILTPYGTRQFWLIASSLAACTVTHILYWALTAPINKVWLKNERLTDHAEHFFGTKTATEEAEWTTLRDRWERSHVYRAITSVIALLLLGEALVDV